MENEKTQVKQDENNEKDQLFVEKKHEESNKAGEPGNNPGLVEEKESEKNSK